MTVTTTTSGAELINEEVIDTVITHYQFDEQRFLPFAHFKALGEGDSGKAEFPRRAKSSVTNPIANESTALSPQVYQPTSVDVTVARAGIAREISESLLEDTVLGRAGQLQDLIMDAAILLGEAQEEDFAAEFANADNSVTNAGSALTIANVVNAVGKQRTARVKGPQVIGLGHRQLDDLQAAQAASQGTPWASFFQPNADGSAFGGFFMGFPIFSSELVPTANTDANFVGCIWAQGQAVPEYSAFAFALKRAVRTKMDEDVLKDTHVMSFITRYGVGTKAANFATSITSRK